MKLTTLTTATLLALTTLSASQPLPDDANIVPIRWNDVEAGVNAAQSSVSASTSAAVEKRERGPRKSKSGAESGYRGGSGLWGRAPEPEPKKKKGGKPGKKIEGANVFDEGGDHRNDPSWG